MKLYNKIQELINESESLKQKNNEVLGLARNELSELVKNKSDENLESLKNTFQGYLDGKLVEMPLIAKENVKELINKQELIGEVRNELLSQFDKRAITNALKQEIKNEIKSELDILLSDRELQSELKEIKKEIVSETTRETTNALTSKILGILGSQLNAITESVIKNLDFSFLAAQPKAFYSVINENVKHPNAKAIGLPRLMLPIGKVWFSLCVPNHRDFTEFELQRIPYRSHTSYLQRRNFAHFLR